MSNTEDIILAEYEKQLAAAVVPDYFLSSQFCNNGTQTTDYVIPPATSADPAAASLATGAPPLQQVKPSLGGAVFPRQQYNGVLRLLSNLLAYLNKGNNFTFDTKNTSGYALGAVLFDYNSNKWVVSLKNANKNNFVTNPTLIDGVNWQFITVNPTGSNNFTVSPTVPTPVITDTTTKAANMAAINQAVTGYATIVVSTAVGGVLTITEAQYRLQFLVLTGTLTSDLIIEFPRLAGKTIAFSNLVTMGNYNITLRIVGNPGTSQLYSGVSYWMLLQTGLSRLSSLSEVNIYGNSYYKYDITTNDNSYRLANTAFVQNISALMGKLSSNNTWTGLNTFTGATKVPTISGTTDSSTNAASTAFVQNVGNLCGKLGANNTWTGLNNFSQIPKVGGINTQGAGIVASGSNDDGYWYKFANNLIVQYGTVTLSAIGNYNAQSIGGTMIYTNYYKIKLPTDFAVGGISVNVTFASSTFQLQKGEACNTVSANLKDNGAPALITLTVAVSTPTLGFVPTIHFAIEGF